MRNAPTHLSLQAPMYVNKRIAENATAHPADLAGLAGAVAGGESHADIVRSVREAITSFEDPCIMLQLQKELAIQEQR